MTPPKDIESLIGDAMMDSCCEGDSGGVRCAVNGVLELVAAICEAKVPRDAEYAGGYGGYGNYMGDKTGPECAAAIRALKVKERGW